MSDEVIGLTRCESSRVFAEMSAFKRQRRGMVIIVSRSRSLGFLVWSFGFSFLIGWTRLGYEDNGIK